MLRMFRFHSSFQSSAVPKAFLGHLIFLEHLLYSQGLVLRGGMKIENCEMKLRTYPLGVHSLEIKLTYTVTLGDHCQEFRYVQGEMQTKEWPICLGALGMGNHSHNPRADWNCPTWEWLSAVSEVE